MIQGDREGSTGRDNSTSTSNSNPSSTRLPLPLLSVSPYRSQLRPSTSISPPPSPPKYAYMTPPSLDDWGDMETDAEVLSLAMPLVADNPYRMQSASPPPSPPPLDDLTDLHLQHVHLGSTPHSTPWMQSAANHTDQSVLKTHSPPHSHSHSSSPSPSRSRSNSPYKSSHTHSRMTFSSPPTPLHHESNFHVSATMHRSPLDVSLLPLSIQSPEMIRTPTIRSSETATAEKGWISHTNKGYTHNAPLNQARANALAARTVRRSTVHPCSQTLHSSFFISLVCLLHYI